MAYENITEFYSSVYQALINDPEITSLCGDAVFDFPPSDVVLPELYIRIGDEVGADASSVTHSGNEMRFSIGVLSRMTTLQPARTLASAVARVMNAKTIAPDAGKLVGIWFFKSQTYRLEGGNLRLIRLWFKAITDNSEIIEV